MITIVDKLGLHHWDDQSLFTTKGSDMIDDIIKGYQNHQNIKYIEIKMVRSFSPAKWYR